MFGIRSYSMLMIITLAASSAGAPGCEKQSENIGRAQDRIPVSEEQKKEPARDPMKELKILAQGGFSEIDRPLVIVAREETVYAALKKLVGGLPDLAPEFFRRSAVVAAFAGQKRTGGYSVKITQSSSGAIQVNEMGPPKGSMVTQVISSPFLVASVELDPDSGDFNVDLGPQWQAAMKRYRLESGKFTMSGGFAGRVEEFDLTGDVSTLKYGNFISVQFSLDSKNADKSRELRTLATGMLTQGTRVSIPEMHAGSLIDPPQPYLAADGELAQDEGTLSLQFKPNPTNVADGFVGFGSIVAKSASGARN